MLVSVTYPQRYPQSPRYTEARRTGRQIKHQLAGVGAMNDLCHEAAPQPRGIYPLRRFQEAKQTSSNDEVKTYDASRLQQPIATSR